MQDTYTRPGKRLTAIASLVREGVRLADVGTDHALLPIYLVGTGHNPWAVASDVHAGPLSRAAKAVHEAGLDNRICTVLTDGLDGLEKYEPQDIVIAGMGGELIARIISGADFVRNPDIRLLLQPMTRSPDLRSFLAENGFSVICDTLCEDDKIYEILCAAYDGRKRVLSPLVRLVGEDCIKCGDPLSVRHMRRHVQLLRRRADGKGLAGQDTWEEEMLIAQLEEAICRSSNFTEN